MIKEILEEKYTKAKKEFNSIITEKVLNKLELKKKEVGKKMCSSEEPDVSNIEEA